MKRSNQWLSLLILLGMAACRSGAPQTKTADNHGLPISYILSGKGDTAVVLVHGWCIDKSYWSNQEPLLAPRYTVVALDLGGHGRSGHNRNQWTIENYSSDVQSVLDQLPQQKIILVGHSMSGEICLKTALDNPGRVIGLIGIDNFKDLVSAYTPEQEKQIDSFFHQMQANFQEMATGYVEQALFPKDADTAAVHRVIRSVQSSDPVMATATLRSLGEFSRQDSALLHRLPFRLHLIGSEPPPNDSVLKAACRYGYRSRMIERTGHYPMIERPDAFNQALLSTLDDIAAGK